MGLITYENLEDRTPITANVFNERFAQIISQLNGNIDVNNIKNAGISKEKLQAEIYESIYPIGSMYVNFTDNTNPATLLGFGTWTAVAGKFVAGYDGNQTEFNAAEKTGGHKELQAHTHTVANGVDGVNSGVGFRASGYKNSGAGVSTGSFNTGSSGSGDGKNLPPYIVGYIWKRTS